MIQIVICPGEAPQPMLLRPPDGARLVRQARTRGYLQDRVSPETSTEIHILSIRNSTEVLIETTPTNHLSAKAHQAATQFANCNRGCFAKLVCLPINRLPLIMK